jgi:hypothetical protein
VPAEETWVRLRFVLAAVLIGAALPIAPAAAQDELSEFETPQFDPQPDDFTEPAIADEFVPEAEIMEPPPPMIAADQATARAAHDALLEQQDLQFERPEQAPPPPVPMQEPRGVNPFFEWLASLFNSLGTGMAWLFYVACAAVVASVVYFLFGEALRARFGWKKPEQRGQPTEADIDIRPDAEEARTLLEEADALARQGKFAEAVHLLLFRSIQDIQKRLANGVPKSMTSREIGVMDALPDRARVSLSPIIRLVEASHFGGNAVDEAGWRLARKSYDDFAFGAVKA